MSFSKKLSLAFFLMFAFSNVSSFAQVESEKNISPLKTAFRIESFVRGLETSGIDGQSRIYQFRGRNLAERPATQCHYSVTS